MTDGTYLGEDYRKDYRRRIEAILYAEPDWYYEQRIFDEKLNKLQKFFELFGSWREDYWEQLELPFDEKEFLDVDDEFLDL